MRACELADGARLVRGRDDEIVRFASKFRRLMDRCESDEDKLEALDAQPAMFEAYTIYMGEDDASEVKWELEARLLGGEPVASIEAKLGIDPATIFTYERVFFDVLSRRHSTSLMVHVVIGRSVQTGLAEREYDCLWKLFSYFAGIPVLDAYIWKFNGVKHVESADGVRTAFREIAKDTIMSKAAVTALTLPANWQNNELILGTWQQICGQEQMAGQASGGTEVMMQNVAVLVEGFQPLLHKHIHGVDPTPGGIIDEIEDTGVRLRSDELAAIATGNDVSGFEHFITAKFPDSQGEDK